VTNAINAVCNYVGFTSMTINKKYKQKKSDFSARAGTIAEIDKK